VTAWEHHVPLAFHSRREADHSPPSIAEVKEWVLTSTPPIRLHGVVLSWGSTGITLLYLRKLGYEAGRWMELAQDRVQWRALAVAVLKFWVLPSQTYFSYRCAKL